MQNFQDNVTQWLGKVFSQEVLDNSNERNFRFLEEAVELVQSANMSKEDVLRIVDYVYDRPVGEIPQEIGGVMVSLIALCNRHGRNLHDDAMTEINRCWQNIEKIRSKQAAKPQVVRGVDHYG